ncbi:MAG TPA: hypothetical protein VN649_10535 [Ramlibacter sp.]|nr:hypothetical protein [Ramlibacter sp.]
MASGNALAVIARVVIAAAVALGMCGCDEDAGPHADPSPWTVSADLAPQRPGQ